MTVIRQRRATLPALAEKEQNLRFSFKSRASYDPMTSPGLAMTPAAGRAILLTAFLPFSPGLSVAWQHHVLFRGFNRR
jgi:hypothetical protein